MDTSLAAPQRILVPTDFSKSAESARLQARHVAARHDAELHVLHVTREERPWMRSRPSLRPSSPVLPSFYSSSEVSAFATSTPFAVRPAPSAVDGILDYAEDHDVDLVVMGTHGERGVRSALLGSTAERVVRRAYPPFLPCALPSTDRLTADCTGSSFRLTSQRPRPLWSPMPGT